MKLTGKLITFAAVMALLAPLVGLLAYVQMTSVAGNLHSLAEESVPGILDVAEMKLWQVEQYALVLSYAANGNQADRQRFEDLQLLWDAKVAVMRIHVASGHGSDVRTLVEKVGSGHEQFVRSATAVFTAREAYDKGYELLTTRDREMTDEFNAITRRFLPAPAGAETPSALAVPQGLRAQIGDLLLANEGMRQVIARQTAVAEGYALRADPKARADFDTLNGGFQNWYQLATAAGGPEDRAIIARVQPKHAEYQLAGRGMMDGADAFVKARASLALQVADVQKALNGFSDHEVDGFSEAHHNADQAISNSQYQILGVALLGCVFVGLLGLWFVHRITRPLVQLREMTDRVSRGELDDLPLTTVSRDEVGELAAAVRRMATSLRYARRKMETTSRRLAELTEDDEAVA